MFPCSYLMVWLSIHRPPPSKMTNNTRQRKGQSSSSPKPPIPLQSPLVALDSPSNKKPAGVEPVLGPLPSKSEYRAWTRFVMMCALSAVIFVTYSRKSTNSLILAKQSEQVKLRSQQIPCTQDYQQDLAAFPGCVPQRCGRLVTDGLLDEQEIHGLAGIAQRAFTISRSSGGASILDLHSGALSHQSQFVNVYKLGAGQDAAARNLFSDHDMALYSSAKDKIHALIASTFGAQPDKLYLTSPTFFSEITDKPAVTVHDEYWHPHIDKETYPSFHFTSLIYLADYGIDFQGGRFAFMDPDGKNRTVEPRRGRVSVFTSGSENLHFVEPVTAGSRYAVTVSFTCDPEFAITQPLGWQT